MAVTHTEVYRPFSGTLARHPFRFLPLFASEIAVATRKKLPLIILFGPVAISTIVVCFLVYARFVLQQGITGDGMSLQAAMAVAATDAMLQVRGLIFQATALMVAFSILVIVFFGAGLICEDRRANAHLLYFSRPLTRLDYFFGKFCTAAFFGSMVALVPNLLICTMAVFSSPEWSFLLEQWDVILSSIAFGLIWISSMGLLVLAVSSLAPKKIFAMVGFFGFVFLVEVFVNVGTEVGDVDAVRYLSIVRNLGTIGEWLFADIGADPPEGLVGHAVGTAGLMLVSGLVLAWRLRRMELSS